MSKPTHGNYRGYYAKRPFITDPRLALVDPGLFAGATVLDVGCNEGWVTCEVAQRWHAKKVIGVDIDPELVVAAWRRRRTVWSAQGPAAAPSAELQRKRPRNQDAAAADAYAFIPPRPDHFPLALAHMFGHLPIPTGSSSDSATTKHAFPHNVVFHAADWVVDGIPEDAAGYDVVLGFSITKWIHLNGGDDGLLAFFRRVASVLRPGGAFILEPQAWDTYAKARRMDPKLRETAKTLKLRPDGFPEVLERLGFCPRERLGMTGEGGFHRPVDLYIKR